MGEFFDKDGNELPATHPISVLIHEHETLLNFADDIQKILDEIKDNDDLNLIKDKFERLSQLSKYFTDAENHYLKEEKILFPTLVKFGVIQPNSWMEHDTIKNIVENTSKLIAMHDYKQLEQIPESFRDVAIRDFVNQMNVLVETLSKVLSLHFNREEEVIFPMALRVLEEKEWKNISASLDKFSKSI